MKKFLKLLLIFIIPVAFIVMCICFILALIIGLIAEKVRLITAHILF